jgi:hypothetical protein
MTSPQEKANAQEKPASADKAVEQTARGEPLPHKKLMVLPPQKKGCYRLVDGRWQEIGCIPDERLKDIPPPQAKINSLQSTTYDVALFRHHITQLTVPFVLAGVSVGFISDPAAATARDITPSGASRQAFSLQANTNFFPCSTCSNGSPFAASQTGDTGWVQFVFQALGSIARLCVWNIDVTIAFNTNNAAGYRAQCTDMSTETPPTFTIRVKPLTGDGAPSESGEVFGYISCPNPGSVSNCMLTAIAYLPWVPPSELDPHTPGSLGVGWWAAVDNDALGLAGNWTNVSGGLLGLSFSSASFTKTRIGTALYAYICVKQPQGSLPFSQVCDSDIFDESVTRLVISSPTAESNNLVDEPATCPTNNECRYNSHSPDCTTQFCN